MLEPILFVIAGCNGSGKSTYSKSLLPENIVAFDADKLKQKIYDSYPFDFDLREEMAWKRTQDCFEKDVMDAIDNRKSFAYETNFNHHPLHWVNRFKLAGYATYLIFFSLENTQLAIERVAIRYQNGGHYVADNVVRQRYLDGFLNLEKHYDQFDFFVVLESSIENEKPKTLFALDNNLKKIVSVLPDYFKQFCPKLSTFINKNSDTI